MIPQLTPDTGAGQNVGTPLPVPPRRFRALEEPLEKVFWTKSDGFSGVGTGVTPAQKKGVRYEEKIQVRLRNLLGPNYHRNPCINFLSAGQHRRVVPDGLFFDPEGTAFVFEIKSQHMPEAWWQLRRLYEPVVRLLPFVNRVSCIEVVRSYDPAMGFPEPIKLCSDLETALEGKVAAFKVFQCRP